MRGYAQDCSNPVNLVLMGPPGAGKGTQAARVDPTARATTRLPVLPADRQCQCGGAYRTRSDDNDSVVRERLRVYERATRPPVNFYRKRSTFCAVDGTLSPERVAAQIELAIDTARENVSA